MINAEYDWDIDDEIDDTDETINTSGTPIIYDHNNGIADPTYINGIIDCSDLGIYPWGNS